MKTNNSWFMGRLIPAFRQVRSKNIDMSDRHSLLAYVKDDTIRNFVLLSTEEELKAAVLLAELADSNYLSVLSPTEKIPLNNYIKASIYLRREGKHDLADKVDKYISAQNDASLNDMVNFLWNSDLELKRPKDIDADYIKSLAKILLDKLKDTFHLDESLLQQAVILFLDQAYFSDPESIGQPLKIFAQHLYYKNKGDELDELEPLPALSEVDLNINYKNVQKYIPC